jgi:hypothetical protein
MRVGIILERFSEPVSRFHCLPVFQRRVRVYIDWVRFFEPFLLVPLASESVRQLVRYSQSAVC